MGWFVIVDPQAERLGPFDRDYVVDLIRRKVLKGTSSLLEENSTTWIVLRSHPEFQEVLFEVELAVAKAESRAAGSSMARAAMFVLGFASLGAVAGFFIGPELRLFGVFNTHVAVIVQHALLFGLLGMGFGFLLHKLNEGLRKK